MVYLQVEPVGILGIYPGYFFKFNLGLVDLTSFRGSGFGHMLRHNAIMKGTDNGSFLPLGDSEWPTQRFRMEHDALSKKLKSLCVADSDFMPFHRCRFADDNLNAASAM